MSIKRYAIRDEFVDAILEAWNGIKDEYINKLFESMPRRMQACIE